MNRKTHSNLWLLFVCYVFLILFLTATIFFAIVALLFTQGLIPTGGGRGGPLSPLFMLAVVSILTGTGISMIVAKKILKPITRMSAATKKVAAGDFTIRLAESSQIKEIREMEENFNRMTHELASIETLRNDFVASVSHEFKTPISAIEGYATLLTSGELSESERTEYARMIMEGVRQLSALTGNILKISKLESQEIIVEKTDFRLDEQIRQALLLLEPEWSMKNQELDVELSEAIYFGSEELLLQVWLNLFSNAIKFTPEGGRIRVGLVPSESEMVVEIADTGIGMNREVQKHIFEKFYQGSKARYTQGNGLGLTFVKRVLDLIGGAVGVESEEGRGSTFTVRLPVASV